MMTKDEYVARAESDEAWAPGWLAIDDAFDALYPGVEPTHLAPALQARAVFGGHEYIDGYSIFPSPHGYQHVVTYGMSDVYAEEEAFGQEFSGCGFEMTMKLRAEGPDDCLWAVTWLGNVGRGVHEKPRLLEPYDLIGAGGRTLLQDSSSLLTACLIVPDTEVPGIDTVHGRLDFLQLVGITQAEREWATDADPEEQRARVQVLASRLVEGGNTHLVTDLARTQEVV